MLPEDLQRLGDQGRRAPFLRRLQVGCPGELFTDELIRLAPLRLKCLVGCLTGEFAAALPAFPPFEKIVTQMFIPNVAAADPVQGNKPPDAGGNTDLLDDPQRFLAVLDCGAATRCWITEAWRRISCIGNHLVSIFEVS